MSGGPNREWKHGDRGPDYHCEAQPRYRHGSWHARPKASDKPEVIVERGWTHPRMGRDPHDKVTMELELLQPIPDDVAVRIAAGLYEESDDEVPWLLLMLKADADYENPFLRGPKW